MKRTFFIALFSANLAWGQAIVQPTTNTTNASTFAIPAPVAELLAKANVPADHVSILVEEIGASQPLVAHNINTAFNPASVMKLLTTYAGLELLGPTYTWKTEIYALGEIKNGTLNGDLAIKGYGDPKLTVERFSSLLRELRERGLKKIKGDLILDRSFFEHTAHDPAQFDGEPLKAYNVAPDALLMNFKTMRFTFAPKFDGKSVAIYPDLQPVQIEVANRVKLSNEPCGEWQDRIKLDVQEISTIKVKVSFAGSYPASCDSRGWSVSLLDHPRFVGGAFASIWKQLGGSWEGVIKLADVPSCTPSPACRGKAGMGELLASIESSPLTEVVRDINKFSNNVMARQLFLTLSANATDKPSGTLAQSEKILRDWLGTKSIPAEGLVLENGAGLSRIERISAQTLGSLLQSAWKSNVMPEFISSLPLVGLDGTMRRRNKGEAVVGKAHIKSGTVNEVRAIAGYVLDQRGKRWVVVMLVNDVNAASAGAAQDALLNWVYQH